MPALGYKLCEEQSILNLNTVMLPSTGLLKGNLDGNYRRKFKVHKFLKILSTDSQDFPQVRTDVLLLTSQVKDMLRFRAKYFFSHLMYYNLGQCL